MFKIGEFSKLTKVTVRMLRYYDEAGLLKPAEIDPKTGYRMYSAGQIPVLNKIIYLRDSGFTIAEMAALMNDMDSESFLYQLELKYKEIEAAIEVEKQKLLKLQLAKEHILENKSKMLYQVSIKSIPGYPVLSLRKTVPDYYAEGALWRELSAFVEKQGVSISSNTFTIYHDQEYKEKDVDIELCVVVKEFGKNEEKFRFYNTEPVPSMASTMVYGDFSNIAGAYQSFAKWLQDNSIYRMNGPSRQIVHRGPWNENNPEQYLIEIQIALETI